MAFTGSENVVLNLPSVQLIANDIGGVFSVPAITLVASDADGYAEITLPAIQLVAEWDTGTTWDATIVVPPISLEAVLDSGGLLEGIINLPSPQIIASWDVSELFSANITVPSVQLVAECLVGSVSSATITVPSIRIENVQWSSINAELEVPAIQLIASASPEIIWAATIEVPSIQLSTQWNTTESVTDYRVYVVNTNTGAHSTYESFNCFGIFKFNGSWFGLFADGIYELTGNLDGTSRIEASVAWAQSDLGSPKLKRVDQVFVTMRNFDETAIQLNVTMDEVEYRTYTKDMTAHPEGMRNHRFLLPRGVQAQNWEFGFKNIDGGDFVLVGLEVESNELKRHTR